MTRSKSSKAWLREHHGDEYVQKSREEGYRSRAAYKLAEIQQKDRVLERGQCVLDLGAAPGGWSEYAAQQVGDSGTVIALDLLPMPAVAGVEFLQGDFTEAETYERLMTMLGERSVDLVLSDMAPNMSGVTAVDQPRAMYLCELALYFAIEHLKTGGWFVAKVFQGEGFEPFLKEVRQHFGKVVMRKPKASRPKSREMYLVAGDFKL